MIKRILLVLVIVTVVVGVVSAQTDFEAMPQNTITVDFGPTIMGAGFEALEHMLVDEGASSSGFGIALQYERQMLEKLTLGGRFAYLGYGVRFTEEGVSMEETFGTNLSSFSFEGHVRYYPSGGTFFLDGMLGYARLTARLSGEAEEESVSFTVGRNYFKLGTKLGWRIDFGRPGGFIFEPSIGYYRGIGLGDTIGKKLFRELEEDTGEEIDSIFSLMENIVFIGGPRVSLAFGWMF